MTYNSYYNRETWIIASWLDDEKRHLIDKYWKDDDIEEVIHEISKVVKNAVKKEISQMGEPYDRLLGISLRKVDWWQIAEKIVNEVALESE